LKAGVRSQNPGVRSQEARARSKEQGVRSQEAEGRRQKTGGSPDSYRDQEAEYSGFWIRANVFSRKYNFQSAFK